jgi:hypothetical protein
MSRFPITLAALILSFSGLAHAEKVTREALLKDSGIPDRRFL